jgi:hypothetical protein
MATESGNLYQQICQDVSAEDRVPYRLLPIVVPAGIAMKILMLKGLPGAESVMRFECIYKDAALLPQYHSIHCLEDILAISRATHVKFQWQHAAVLAVDVRAFSITNYQWTKRF